MVALLFTLLVAWATAVPGSAQDALGGNLPSGERREVGVGVWIVDIDSIDSAEQRFLASVFLVLEWHDPSLAHPGPQPVKHAIDDVWNPEIQVVNETGIVRRTLPEVVVVDPDGNAMYRQHFVGTYSQPLDFTDFPFDQHEFSVHFVAIGHSPEEIEFTPAKYFVDQGLAGAAGIAADLSLPDWDVIGWQADSMPYFVAPNFAVAGYALRFTAARRAGYYLFKIILPLVLIVLMSWAVFWIDSQNASSKISVSVTAMLTLIAYRFAIAAHVPPLPYMTRLDRFILASTVLVFLTLVEVVLSSRLSASEQKDTARWMDKIARVVFPTGFVLCGAWALL